MSTFGHPNGRFFTANTALKKGIWTDIGKAFHSRAIAPN